MMAMSRVMLERVTAGKARITDTNKVMHERVTAGKVRITDTNKVMHEWRNGRERHE
jgi:hypothetical protein